MAAQIFVKVDKEFYFAGDTVQGQVFLNLYENMNANEVLIKFKGWESVRWIQKRHLSEEEAQRVGGGLIWNHNLRVKMDSSDSSSDEGEEESMKYNYVRQGGQVYQVYRYSGGRIVAKFQSVLYNFGGQFIPAGQYTFPFSFKTGEDYPASFCVNIVQRKDKDPNHERKGRTKYEMRVFVRGFNGRRRLIKHRTEIVIRETTVIKNDKQEIEAHVKSCCCCDQGISKIQCYFDKNAYSPAQQAKIYCILNTRQSQADVTKVTVALVNKIIYTSKENHQRVIEDRLFTQEFPGLPKGQEVQRNKSVIILNQKNQDKYAIKPTSRGSRLQSIYFLRVEAELDASCTCCSELPVVNQPIVIYPLIPVNYFFQAPPNWSPQVMPMMNLENAFSAQNGNLNQMNNPYY